MVLTDFTLIANLAMMSVTVSPFLDLHSSLAWHERTAQVGRHQVLTFAALSSQKLNNAILKFVH